MPSKLPSFPTERVAADLLAFTLYDHKVIEDAKAESKQKMAQDKSNGYHAGMKRM